MEWVHTLAIIGSLGGLMIWICNKLDGDIKGMSARLDSQGVRMDGHAKRIDQLYTMFVDLLKERK